jgi:predicted MFS family arabinose efflux permease
MRPGFSGCIAKITRLLARRSPELDATEFDAGKRQSESVENGRLGLALMDVSMGCVMPATTAGVLASSPSNSSGVASGLLNSARQVGGTLGVALMGSLFQSLHMQGLLFCFALVLVCFLLVAGVTVQAMRENE